MEGGGGTSVACRPWCFHSFLLFFVCLFFFSFFCGSSGLHHWFFLFLFFCDCLIVSRFCTWFFFNWMDSFLVRALSFHVPRYSFRKVQSWLVKMSFPVCYCYCHIYKVWCFWGMDSIVSHIKTKSVADLILPRECSLGLKLALSLSLSLSLSLFIMLQLFGTQQVTLCKNPWSHYTGEQSKLFF